jgi:phage-related protein
MASPIVNVNVLADTKRFSSSMKSAGDDTNFLTKGLKNVGIAAGVAFAAAGTAAIAFGVASVKAAAESEAISKGMENAAKNAGVFGESAGDIAKATKALDDHSTKLAELTGLDDELFNSMKTGWLATPSLAALGTEGINNLATVAADVAKGTGKDIGSIGLAFTKVAGDSETALSKLTRQGIVLEDSQKAVYEAMVANGDEAGAQAYLIETLGQKYAGAAEAAANPFERLKVIFENLMETVGKALLPAIEKIVPVIADFITNLTADPAFQVFLEELSTTFGQLLEAIMPLLPPLMDLILSLLPPLMDLVKLLVPVILTLVEAFMPLIDGILPPLISLIETLLPPLMEFLMAVITPLVPIIVQLVEAFAPLLEKILPPLLDVFNAIVPVVMSLLEAFMPFIEKLLPPLLDLFMALLDPLIQLLDAVLPLLIPIIETFGNTLTWLLDNVIGPVIDGISGLVGWFADLLGLGGKKVNVSATMSGAINAPKLAKGGIVMPRPGGTLATIGEAGQAEAVIPLDKLKGMGGNGVNVTIQGNVGWDPAAVADMIARKQRQAYALQGLNGIIGVR